MIDIIGVTAISTLILLVGLYGDDWFWRIQMNDNLPPPNWSPTGDEGYWVWGMDIKIHEYFESA